MILICFQIEWSDKKINTNYDWMYEFSNNKKTCKKIDGGSIITLCCSEKKLG